MEMKTQRETLVELYNEQLALVLNRKASLRMLQKMPMHKVLTKVFDQPTLQMREVTVQSRLAEMSEAMELDQGRLDELSLMLSEMDQEAEGGLRTGVEKTA